MEQIQRMYQEVVKLQDYFNSIVDKDWKEKRHLQDWAVAVFDESAEILGSFPWKWWKKMNFDVDNVKIELVDIFHFIISQLIQLGKTELTQNEINRLKVIYEKYEEFRSLDKEQFIEKCTHPEFIRTYTAMLNTLVSLMFSAQESNKEVLGSIILQTFNALVAPFMRFEELVGLYIGKNALNKLRQDFGYKTGEYVKDWNGKEDNIVMQELLSKMQPNEITFENMYDKLKSYYSTLVLNTRRR